MSQEKGNPTFPGDNFLIICKEDFSVWEGTVLSHSIYPISKGKDLEEAIEQAESYEEDLFLVGNFLEFGIHFVKDLRGYDKKDKHQTTPK